MHTFKLMIGVDQNGIGTTSNPVKNPIKQQVSIAKPNLPNSNPKKDIVPLMVIASTILVFILALVIVFRYVVFDRNNQVISTQSTISASPYPNPEQPPTGSRLKCKPVINGQDLDLIISNIPASATQINSFMYTIGRRDFSDGENSLKRYYPSKQPINKNELTIKIKNLDGDGPPEPQEYYIIASTQKPLGYDTAEKLKRDVSLFRKNHATEDTCYVFITPQYYYQ